METFTDTICPLCKISIKEGEPVKSCPSCGIPHHAICWEKNRGCAACGYGDEQPTGNETKPEIEAKAEDICRNCGTPLKEEHTFCSNCGAPRYNAQKNICAACGTQIPDFQEFCPQCGQRAGNLAGQDRIPNDIPYDTPKKKKRKALFITLGVIGAFVILAAILLVVILSMPREPAVEEIILAETAIELDLGDKQSISYTIHPKEAKDVQIEWSSSNEDVATVNDEGRITAKGEGTCVITASAGEKTDSLTVTVKEKPDFMAVYIEYCDPSWATLSKDGSYLMVDTNPDDLDDHTDYGAFLAISEINSAFGLPDSVYQKMLETRSLDGRQYHYTDTITISWTYHPDQGLEIIYEAN